MIVAVWRCRVGLAVLVVPLLVTGCARYRPEPVDPPVLARRAERDAVEGVRVAVAVPGDEEARRIFGVDLAEERIQPVWLQIENESDAEYWFAPAALDPGYFTPRAAALRCELWFGGAANERMRRDFVGAEIPTFVPAHGRVEGFLFSRHERGMKVINVDLIGRAGFRHFVFIVEVPGFRPDVTPGKFDKLYDAEQVRDVDEAALRAALAEMPCCATTEDGTGTEDPLNFVLLGDRRAIFASLLRAGWKVSEVLDRRSAFRLFYSYFFDEEYLHAPISSVYLFGRRQDLAMEKTRETARERNHLRVWMTALRFQGHPVWIGQIDRDIGLSYSLGSFLGHRVDPDVDEARGYLVQDLLWTQQMRRFGWVTGVGVSRPPAPRRMEDGTPIYTDGLRAVMEFGDEWTPFDAIGFFDWERAAPEVR